MTFKLLKEQHLEFLSLKGSCTGSSESTHFKMPHCWKLHVAAHYTDQEIRFFYLSCMYQSLKETSMLTYKAGQMSKLSNTHEFEGRIEKSVPRISIWHHEAIEKIRPEDRRLATRGLPSDDKP